LTDFPGGRAIEIGGFRNIEIFQGLADDKLKFIAGFARKLAFLEE
jgi:hypothetical protein